MEIVRVRSRLVRWPMPGEGAARGRTDRAAILVEVRTSTGAIGLGEAAPLVGTSTDTLDDVAAAIEAMAARVPFTIDGPGASSSRSAGNTPESIRDASRGLAATIADLASSLTTGSSARFAIETALLTAAAEEARCPLAELLAAAYASELDAAVTREHDPASPGSARENRRRVARRTVLQSAWDGRSGAPDSADAHSENAMTGEARTLGRGAARSGATIAPPSAALPSAVVVDNAEQAVRAVAAGAQVLKIKVGPTGDLERVIEIHRAAPEALLRLDANRTWQRALTRPLLHALAELPVDFVEEPCVDAHELLVDPLPCPIALDESLAALSDAAIDRALAAPGLAALVLKPTLISGLAACIALAARARAAGKDAVVTHALEGPIGTAACAELALALGGRCSVGLAPHPALDGWSTSVAQLGASTVRRVEAPGLGLGCDLDQLIAPRQATRGAAVDGALAATSHIADRQGATEPTLAQASRVAGGEDATGRARAGAGARTVPARVVVATPTQDTIHAIHAALEQREPIALLHARLPEAERSRQRALVEAATLPPDVAVILFTSGSTGPARGVVISRGALEAAAAASAAHLGWRDDDRWLLALPMAHAGGLAVVVRCWLAGMPIALLAGDFDRARAAALLEDCTLASLVPTQLEALLDDPAWRSPPRLRALLLGGAAASRSVLAEAAARGVPFLTSYGLTETFGQIATAPLSHAGDPDAPLVTLSGVEVRAGTRAQPELIRIHGPMLATAYLDGAPIAPELTTADLGFTESGVLHIVGRADDVIVSGGEKVHPSVVEAVLAATPGVRAACVFAVPDPRWGQIVGAAIVVGDADASFDEATALAAWTEGLPSHARPRELAITRALPLLPSGKVDRHGASQLARVPLRYR